MASINSRVTLQDNASATVPAAPGLTDRVEARRRRIRVARLADTPDLDPNDPEARGVDPDRIHDFSREDTL